MEFWGLYPGEAIFVPDDPFTTQRQQIDLGLKPRPSKRQPDPLKKFLEKDRQILRFFVYWDDRYKKIFYFNGKKFFIW